MGSAHGGAGRWGQAITWMGMPDEILRVVGAPPDREATSTTMAGVGPDDVDVALLYDHFTGMVLMQLEDYGFCGIGEGGDVRRPTATSAGPTAALPVNTHGGNLSEAYIIGMTHVKEAVEQLRGTAVNQVDGRGDRARHRRSRIDPGLRTPAPPLS